MFKIEELLVSSRQLIRSVSDRFIRYLYRDILWDSRLVGIKGTRGTGKSTLVLQYLKLSDLKPDEKAYISLDDIYFLKHTLLDFGMKFYQSGGKLLVLDEILKYPHWTRGIKNLNDRYPELKIVFTGSSIKEISKMEGYLSRRAIIYELKGMSFREYLLFSVSLDLPILDLDLILHGDFHLGDIFPVDFKPLKYFKEFLQFGYYPFIVEGKKSYYQCIRQIVRTIVEYDMAEVKGFDIRQARKLLQLLYIISQHVPFKPNLSSLAQKSDIHRNSINNYLYFLDQSRLISLLYHHIFSISSLQKPEKYIWKIPTCYLQ